MRRMLFTLALLSPLTGAAVSVAPAWADDDTSSQQDNQQATQSANQGAQESSTPVVGTWKAIDDTSNAVEKSGEADRKAGEGK